MKKRIIALLLMAVVLVALSGCVSKPDTDIFFTCKDHRPENQTAFGLSYPKDFFEVGRNRFSERDGTFLILYYNKFAPAGFHVRIFGPGGKFCHEGATVFIPQGLYYYFKPNISEFVKRCGYGKYEAKLCRDGTMIKTLEFYLEDASSPTIPAYLRR